MTNYRIGEGQSPYEEFETNTKIVVGDTIEHTPNNQQGYAKYKVVLNEDGEKELKMIDSYDHQMGMYDYSDNEENEEDDNTVLGKRSNDDSSYNESSKRRYEGAGGRKRRTKRRRVGKKSKKGKKRKGKKTRKNKRSRSSKK